MDKIRNAILMEAFIKAIYNVASRRTSSKFADEAIGSTIKTLEGKYDFLKFININKLDTPEGFSISIASDIDNVRPEIIGKAIEALIRVVYNDIGNEAGLYFITELKESAGEEISRMITDYEVDLDQVQFEQHYAFKRREKKRAIAQAAKTGSLGKKRPENLLEYNWETVSYWRHEPGSKYCTLYDKQGNVLDRLNLDRIIQNYVEKLSSFIDLDESDVEKEASIYAKEYELLKLLLERDMDAETAMHMLKITREQLNKIISKLAEMEMLQYIDHNTIELTDAGVGYITNKNKNKS
jgi:hypothetical protein